MTPESLPLACLTCDAGLRSLVFDDTFFLTLGAIAGQFAVIGVLVALLKRAL
jgi:hypothetical protein